MHENADNLNISDLQEEASTIGYQYLKGLVFLNKHKDEKAEEAFKNILNSDKNQIEARWGLAEVMRREHKLKKSEEILKEIIEERTDFSPAYISLAYIEYTTMDWKQAIRLAEKVIDQGRDKVDTSNYVRAYLIIAGSRGLIAYHGGLFTKLFEGLRVFSTLKKAAKIRPDSAAVALGMGSFYLLAPAIAGGDIDKAETYLKDAIESDPLLADAYVRLAQVYKAKGDPERYKAYLDKAVRIDPGNELANDIKSGKCNFICVD